MLNDVIAVRDEVTRLVGAKRRQRDELDTEINGLKSELTGLGLYLNRHGVQVATCTMDESVRWRAMSRRTAVVEALRTMGIPGSPTSIAGQLRRLGRDDKPTDVSRALNHLKEQDRVVAVGRGQWIPRS